MSDSQTQPDTDMDTPMTLLVQGLLIQGLRGTPQDDEARGEQADDVLYLKEVKIYSGGALVAEMAHLRLERSAIAGVSAGRVTLLGAVS